VGQVIDADIHHEPSDLVQALSPYLSKVYAERLDDYGLVRPDNPFASAGGANEWHRDGEADPGIPPVQDPELMGSRYLDVHGIDVGVLTGGPLYAIQTMTDLDYASAVCSAFNDWSLENWVAKDDRFRFCIAVNTRDPARAASEIDRLGKDERVCGVLLPSGSERPYGQRYFDPIIDAAANHRLPLVIHVGGDGLGVVGNMTASGTPTYQVEARLITPSFVQVHLASFIFEGVFTRHPHLRVAILGAGFGWLPSYVWRMDEDWKGLRWSTPWVDQPPSSYVSQHMRVGSHPMIETEEVDQLELTLAWMNAEKTLLFASHHPGWDSVSPDTTFPASDDLKQRILGENAADTFRLLVA
jgi:uncharacterized protein